MNDNSITNVVPFNGVQYMRKDAIGIPNPADMLKEIDDVNDLVLFLQREIRFSKMTFQEIGLKAGVRAQIVAKLAYGELKDPRSSVVIRILSALGRKLHV